MLGKVFGWILVIFSSLVLFVLISTFFVLGIYFMTSEEETDLDLESLWGYLLLFAVTVLLFWRGWTKVRAQKAHEIEAYEGTLSMAWKQHMSWRDYRNVMLEINFKSKGAVLFAVAFLMLVANAFFALGKEDSAEYPYALVAVLFMLPVLVPFALFRQYKRAYASNRSLHEELSCTLTNEAIEIKGSTVDTYMNWNHFMRIRETKHFFLLYQSHMVANFLDKRQLSEAECKAFRKFIRSLDVQIK